MPDLVTSKTFVDGEKGITAAKMNQIISGSVIQPGFYNSKPSSPTLDPTDVLLELKASGSYAQITGSQLIASVGATLSVTTTFITKSAAYTLTPTDSNKYIICSGGSWALTLPTPAVGLIYRVRNDMGIVAGSTTGTITLQTAGGTIDGAVSIPLLPKQECTIISDGVNWRTLGLAREVILGTLDISSSISLGSVLLPVGYRYFELQFDAFAPVASNDILIGQLSNNGGSSWLTATSYYHGVILSSSASAVVNFDAPAQTAFYIIPQTASGGRSKLTIYPGGATLVPSWTIEGGARNTTAFQVNWRGSGLYNSAGVINAIKYSGNGGNIANCLLTVKGVV